MHSFLYQKGGDSLSNTGDATKAAFETRQMFGRRMIKSSVREVNRGNVLEVLQKAKLVHSLNRSEIDYLWNYYRGKQPILNRVKDVRPEICNRIVENRANEIVSFKVGYLSGEPIQYVSRNSDEQISRSIAKLNELMFAEDKPTKDQEIVEWQMICGTAFRLVLPDSETDLDESPFEIYTLDPRDTFVVYSNDIGNKPLMAVKYAEGEDGKERYSIYTQNQYFLVEDRVIVEEQAHALGVVPIFEYPANNARLGMFVEVRLFRGRQV